MQSIIKRRTHSLHTCVLRGAGGKGISLLYLLLCYIFVLQRLNELINPDMEEKRGDEMEMLSDPEKNDSKGAH